MRARGIIRALAGIERECCRCAARQVSRERARTGYRTLRLAGLGEYKRVLRGYSYMATMVRAIDLVDNIKQLADIRRRSPFAVKILGNFYRPVRIMWIARD